MEKVHIIWESSVKLPTTQSGTEGDHKKTQVRKKRPLVPRYMQQTYHRIQERTWIKRPRLANMISER